MIQWRMESMVKILFLCILYMVELLLVFFLQTLWFHNVGCIEHLFTFSQVLNTVCTTRLIVLNCQTDFVDM